jgi:hypothetical protein
MAQFASGARLSLGQLKVLLTKSEYRLLANATEGRAPDAFALQKAYGRLLTNYMSRLKDGDKLYVSARRALKSPKASIKPGKSGHELFREAESRYSFALESLAEALGDEPGIASCMDRRFGWHQTDQSDVSLTLHGMPRPLWSKSNELPIEAPSAAWQLDAIRQALHRLL